MKIPAELDNHNFRLLWEEYLTWRKQMKFRPLKAATLQRRLNTLAEWGLQDACTAITQAMQNQWQGLFPPTKQAKSSRKEIDYGNGF